MAAIGGIPVGDQQYVLPTTLNVLFPYVDSEALIVRLQGVAAISNGSACTSSSYKPSHVLQAMGMSDRDATRCIRFSWCHLTQDFDWADIANCIKSLGVN
jgi:cysteine desulfurase